MKSKPIVGLVALSLFTATSFSGCASPEKRTGIGAGAGAATGAAVGGIFGGWKGAGIGAAVGAAAGGLVGNRLDKQAQELRKVADTKRTAEGIVVNLKNDLLFETNSAVLKPQAVSDLASLGDIISKYPKDRIRVEGYTDNTGAVSYNEALSLRRAEAVRNVLTSHGVASNQITVMGMGKNNPIANNNDPKGRSQNRRVELHIEDIEQKTSTS